MTENGRLVWAWGSVHAPACVVRLQSRATRCPPQPVPGDPLAKPQGAQYLVAQLGDLRLERLGPIDGEPLFRRVGRAACMGRIRRHKSNGTLEDPTPFRANRAGIAVLFLGYKSSKPLQGRQELLREGI